MGPGIACTATQDRAEFSGVLLVSNAAVLKQADCGLQFTSILDTGITDMMGNQESSLTRCARGIDRAPRPDRYPKIPRRSRSQNWHTANTTNIIAGIHYMLNGQDMDLAEMAQSELWEVNHNQ